MVVMSLDLYDSLTDSIEAKLDEADIQAASIETRLSHDEVFSKARSLVKSK